MNRKRFPMIEIDRKKAQEAIALARRSRSVPFPAYEEDGYAQFARTGNRVAYEQPYFLRRSLLITFALAQWLQPDETFSRRIEEGVELLLAEPSWCLPAHNAYERDAPVLAHPDPERPIIDLFSAETGATLALIQRLVPLDVKLAKAVDAALVKRIKRPYLSTHFWWMGGGEEVMCNWSPWCLSNVLLVFLLTGGDVSETRLASMALATLGCFLKDLGDDGGYPEGIEYWGHGVLPLAVSLSLLKAMGVRQAFELERTPKVQALYDFPLAMKAQGPWYLNWGDCSARARVGDARIFLCGRTFPCEEELSPDGMHDALVRILSLEKHEKEGRTEHQLPYYHYPSLGLSVWHREGWDLGLRAGSNGFSHQHHDLGSLTLYREGKPWLVDVGVERYTAKTFSKERYSIWTMRSPWHSTVNPPGGEQVKDGKARELASNAQGFSGSFDDAYPAGWKWTRTLSVGAQIAVEDLCPACSVLTLISQTRPEVRGNELCYPALGSIRFRHWSSVRIEEIPVTDERLKTAWKGSLFRVLVEGGPFHWVIVPKEGT